MGKAIPRGAGEAAKFVAMFRRGDEKIVTLVLAECFADGVDGARRESCADAGRQGELRNRAHEAALADVVHGAHEAAQRIQFAEVEGQIALKGGSGSANTLVELVDKAGRVVQATRTTEQGNYRFKTVDQGDYRVRVRKQGFSDLEQPIQAAPAAAPAKASMSW